MTLTDLQLSSAEMLAKILTLGRIPNSKEDVENQVSAETLEKAIDVFNKRKYTKALTLALIIEGIQHGSFRLLNYRVKCDPLHEIKYVLEYTKYRKKWLKNKYPNELYKIDTFIYLLNQNNWNLEYPIKVQLSNGGKLTIEVVDDLQK